jgi:hypothetical protein
MKREEILAVAKPILFNTDMARAILGGRKTQTRRPIKPQPTRDDIVCGRRNTKPESAKYQVGDILYIKEPWRKFGIDFPRYEYAASWDYSIRGKLIIPWCEPRKMPTSAARIFLRITSVSVERLQSISVDDICEEGLISASVNRGDYKIAIQEFQILWDSIYRNIDGGIYSQSENPWVFVYKFERVEVRS